ncbi:MAG: hypothetical protein ACRD6X_15035, partial [Pyrinomonadaceae bacterium]
MQSLDEPGLRPENAIAATHLRIRLGMKREQTLSKPFCLRNAVDEHLLLQRKNCVHVINAHVDLRLANHALK